MSILIFALFIPICVLAQVEFENIRVSAHESFDFGAPAMSLRNGEIYCAWTYTDFETATVVTKGRYVSPDGDSFGALETLRVQGIDSITCLPWVNYYPLADGNWLQVYFSE
jgi:hypothetical protein